MTRSRSEISMGRIRTSEMLKSTWSIMLYLPCVLSSCRLRSASGIRKYSGCKSYSEYWLGEAFNFRAAQTATDEALFNASTEGIFAYRSP
ncbi:MAG: hypothetical protein WAO23_06075, partial [Dethiobacteria bacterium]